MAVPVLVGFAAAATRRLRRRRRRDRGGREDRRGRLHERVGQRRAAVGGDAVDVASLINDAAADPHAYEASPKTPPARRAPTWSSRTAAATTTSSPAAEERHRRPADQRRRGLRRTQGGEQRARLVRPPHGQQARRPDRRRPGQGRPGRHGHLHHQRRGLRGEARQPLEAEGGRIKARPSGGERRRITEPVPLYLLEAAGLVNATPAGVQRGDRGGDDVSARRSRRP